MDAGPHGPIEWSWLLLSELAGGMHKFLVDVDDDNEHVTRNVERRLSISRQRFDVA
jgi:hypothetical protein